MNLPIRPREAPQPMAPPQPSSPHRALPRATLLYFLHLRKQHPDFCIEDLLQALDLPRVAGWHAA